MPQRLSDVPLSLLVPGTQRWTGGAGIDLLSWISCVGSFEHSIAYGELFWPEFVEFDGCIFFAEFSQESYYGFMQQTGGDKQAVEAVMNHRHILGFFVGDASHSPTEAQVVYLGRLLREMWATKLQRDFPNRLIVVSFPEEGCKSFLDLELTFYQEHTDV